MKECGSPTEIETVVCDLQDLDSVKSAAEKINEVASKNEGLDFLVCNAGVMALKDVRTKDGFDVQVQTNQHSHFLLTQGVWKSIVQATNTRGAARVVTHSSSARHNPKGPLEKDFFVKSEPGTLGGETTSLVLQFLWKKRQLETIPTKQVGQREFCHGFARQNRGIVLEGQDSGQQC